MLGLSLVIESLDRVEKRVVDQCRNTISIDYQDHTAPSQPSLQYPQHLLLLHPQHLPHTLNTPTSKFTQI
jgi:hypothetical protein